MGEKASERIVGWIHEGVGGYKLYVPKKHDVVVSREVESTRTAVE